MLTRWGQSVDCTFKAIKSMGLTSRGNDLEGLAVLVAADFTLTHHDFFPQQLLLALGLTLDEPVPKIINMI